MRSGGVGCECAERVRGDGAEERLKVVGEGRVVAKLDIPILSVREVVVAEVGSAQDQRPRSAEQEK